MKFSQLVSFYAAAVLAHSSDHQHRHHDLGGVCESGPLPLNGDFTCQPDTEYLSGGQNGWRCPNGTTCEYAHHAWTHTSPCFEGSKTGQDYCVFTDTKFADRRGTSLVMTRRRADYLATNPAFTDPNFITGTNEDPAVYDIKEFPGKGMGLMANQFIRRGDLIMANAASLMVDYRIFHELTRDRYKELQLYAVNYLPEQHRWAILNLSTHGQTFSSQIDMVEKIGELNAFDIDPDADDEELTLSYINPIMLREARLRKLNRNWGFRCACAACRQEKTRAEVSDTRIRKIKELRPKLRNWKAGSPATPQIAELLISLYKQERLWGSMYYAYSFAAYEYNAIGDPWSAIKYGLLLVECASP